MFLVINGRDSPDFFVSRKIKKFSMITHIGTVSLNRPSSIVIYLRALPNNDIIRWLFNKTGYNSHKPYCICRTKVQGNFEQLSYSCPLRKMQPSSNLVKPQLVTVRSFGANNRTWPQTWTPRYIVCLLNMIFQSYLCWRNQLYHVLANKQLLACLFNICAWIYSVLQVPITDNK